MFISKLAHKITFILLIIAVLSGNFVLPREGRSQTMGTLQSGTNEGRIETVELDADKIFSPQEGSAVSAGQSGVSARVKAIQFQKKFESQNLTESLQVTQATAINPIDNGINFLAANQTIDGSWSQNSKATFVNTAAVADVLATLNQRVGNPTSTQQLQIDGAYPKAKDWILLAFPESNDYGAQQVVVLAEAGDDTTALGDFLTAQINEVDFGFGFKKEFTSDLVTTAKVLAAISASNYQDPGSDPQYTLKAALLYLLQRQNADGGWSEVAGEASSLFATNAVLEALLPYRNYIIAGVPGGDIVIGTKVAFGLDYLKGGQQSDGTWGGDFLDTALSYHALISYLATPIYNQQAIDYLLASQNPNGSFGSGAGFFTTAKALAALGKPDMAVVDIQNTSGLVPNATTSILVTIKNEGFITSDALNLAQQPTAFILTVDGKDIPLTFPTSSHSTVNFESDATLLLDVELKGLAFGTHAIGFRVDYAGAEFKKNNNALIRTLLFDDPTFTGPTPPPWIGARTADIPGRIYLGWQPSPSSTTAYYGIYTKGSTGYSLLGTTAGTLVGINVSNPQFYGVPLVFAVASFDAVNVRGDYSMETQAAAYGNPASAAGTISGRVVDNNGSGVPSAEINLYQFGSYFADSVGNHTLVYYPGFYWMTSSQSGYTSHAKEVQIVTQQSVSGVNFTLPIIDGGGIPPPVAGLAATPGDRQITLSWNQFSNTDGDFKHFNIYRATTPITNVSGLVPINESITNPAATSFVDTTIVNGVAYHYAVVPEDFAGNFTVAVQGVGPVKGNSAPQVANLSAVQQTNTVTIAYDVVDAENSTAQISFEYFDGVAWRPAQTTVGEGSQLMGAGKSGVWNARQDFPGFDGQIKVKVRANDGQAVNAVGENETGFLNLDTKDPVAPAVTGQFPLVVRDFTKVFTGAKEVNASLRVNGVEIVPVNASTTWTYTAILRDGSNAFSFASRDAFLNQSPSVEIEVIYDSTIRSPSGSPGRHEIIPLEPCDECEGF